MKEIKEYIKYRKEIIKDLIKPMNKKPSLAIINTLDDPASLSYIKGKVKDAEELGIKAEVFYLEDNLTFREFRNKIEVLSHDGIIIQLPLHPNYEKYKDNLIKSIPFMKDVDGLTKDTLFYSCTPRGILDFLSWNDVTLDGANVVIIGRSDLVGRPLARLMLDENATVTLCHSHTKNLAQHTLNADIIVCAAGRPSLLTDEHIRDDKSQIVIDVGINRVNAKLCGDVSPEVKDYVKYLSPVPGGVGLLTRMALMENVCVAAHMREGLEVCLG